MNWRVKIITLALLGLFGIGCFLYIRFYVAPKAHGVILFIAPATDLNQLAGLQGSLLNVSSPEAALITDVMIHPASHYSHLATGLPNSEFGIGVNEAGEPLDTLFYQAQRSNRRIGIVSTAAFTHPAAAAFYYHSPEASDPAHIAPQLFDSTTINVMLGGNPDSLTLDPTRNLICEAEQRGYQVIRNPDEISEIPRWRTRLLLGVFDYPDDLFDPGSHATSPALEEMVILAIECLQFHIGGYFLVVVHPDPAEIPFAGELPQEFRRAHTFQLNKALQAAYDYTGENGTVLLYSPQPNSTGWLLQLKGNTQPPGILNLGQLNAFLQTQF